VLYLKESFFRICYEIVCLLHKCVANYNFWINGKDFNSVKEDLAYWLSKTPEERIEAVELLRKQLHGS
jgi:hypothetical protein